MYKSPSVNTSFKYWMKKHFDAGQLEDMAAQGARVGFPYLTYNSDTTVLYRKYHADIWDMLAEDADNMGFKHPLEMIATFGGAENAITRMTFETLMVWYAAERVAALG